MADQWVKSTRTEPPFLPVLASLMCLVSLVCRSEDMLHMSSFMLRTFSRVKAGATMLRIRRCSEKAKWESVRKRK